MTGVVPPPVRYRACSLRTRKPDCPSHLALRYTCFICLPRKLQLKCTPRQQHSRRHYHSDVPLANFAARSPNPRSSVQHLQHFLRNSYKAQPQRHLHAIPAAALLLRLLAQPCPDASMPHPPAKQPPPDSRCGQAAHTRGQGTASARRPGRFLQPQPTTNHQPPAAASCLRAHTLALLPVRICAFSVPFNAYQGRRLEQPCGPAAAHSPPKRPTVHCTSGHSGQASNPP